MLIHTHNVSKSRKRKSTKADVQRLSDYNNWRRTQGLPIVNTLKAETYKRKAFVPLKVTGALKTPDMSNRIPSLETDVCDTSRKDVPKYTGENLLGIAVMHKSNLVPVFKKEQAVEISRMRRG